MTCSKCGGPIRRDNRYGICMRDPECAKARKAAHYAAHKEEAVAYRAAYYAAHKEEAVAYSAAYYAAHKEEIAAYYADPNNRFRRNLLRDIRNAKKELSQA